jgi:Flp pilus assembly secretin CpaC
MINPLASQVSPRRTGRPGPVTAALLGAATALAVASAALPARAEDLIVKYDQSQLLKLPRPAAEIIIGNPAIADISVQAGNLLVITGKTFGITNIIALDADRNVIQDQRILVRRDEAKVVNLQRGINRQSYNCTPQCNPSIIIGDDNGYFENISKAAEKKMGFSERAADSAPQGSGQ